MDGPKEESEESMTGTVAGMARASKLILLTYNQGRNKEIKAKRAKPLYTQEGTAGATYECPIYFFSQLPGSIPSSPRVGGVAYSWHVRGWREGI